MTDLWRLSATETTARIRAREVSAREVARSALNRLAAVNPAINAVVQEMPEQALAAAGAVDAALARGEDPGPLAGVPVTIKVNVDQQGFATTNGLRIQAEQVAEADNPVVANLRRAGAVVIGRTNTPAFSLRWFTRNGLHGHTLNPRNPALTPGGSSGGAAAATAAGIGAIGHGTDIGGSIRFPAYACGIHGLRPTLGRVPAWNPSGAERAIGAQLMAVSGPLARSVADIRLGLLAMMAEDLRDPWWAPVPLDLPPLPRRAALCVRPEGLNTAPEVEKALRDAAARLQDAGWSIVETPCPPLREPAALQAMLWLAENRRHGNAALARENDPDANIVFAQMEALCPEVSFHGFQDALQKRAGFTRQWQMFLQRYPVLLLPVCAELPFPDLLDVASPEAFRRVMEAQLTQVGLPLMGLPGLSVATGSVAGPLGAAPVGVQLIAGRYREDMLLDAGAIIEAGSMPVTACDPVPTSTAPGGPARD
ncbi:amidase family protein [Roseomonas haemaphysalidis]|uniref:Amidase family protein n=1 Tax=Roseomonas haemaphysalidis TaxID=2768162 RepID=A0ABS3KJ03_9PROT|nr:amidase family protein [Roseomonas haemaphysalidis]MBO1077455.1 amidase family protein [Roseomonas haemaphysalidis]